MGKNSSANAGWVPGVEAQDPSTRDAQPILTVHFWTRQRAGTRTLVAIPTDGAGNPSALKLLDERGAVAADAIKGIYRVVFHPEADTPAGRRRAHLVVDVNADDKDGDADEARLAISANGTVGIANLSVRLLCALNDRSRATLACRIETVAGAAATASRFVYNRLTLDFDAVNSLAQRLPPLDLLGGRRLVDAIDDSTALSFDHRGGLSPGHLRNGDADKGPALDLNYAAPAVRTRVTFPRRHTLLPPPPRDQAIAEADKFHVFRFHVVVPNRRHATRMRTFAAKGDAPQFSESDCEGDWTFVQRPLATITPAPREPAVPGRPPAAEWLLSVAGVPARAVVLDWEKLRAPYHEAFPRIQGSSRLSLVPQLLPAEFTPSLRARMIYRLEDRADDATPGIPGFANNASWAFHDTAIDPADRHVCIIPRSLHLAEAVPDPGMAGTPPVVAGLFPYVATTLTGAPLAVSIPIRRSYVPGESDLEAAEGVVVYTAGPMRFGRTPTEPARGLPPQLAAGERTVRIGSLDLIVAATPAEPADGRLHLTKDTAESHLQLAIADIAPGGQDQSITPDPDERDDQDTDREPPLVIVKNTEGTAPGRDAAYILDVTESAGPRNSQTVSLELRAIGEKKATNASAPPARNAGPANQGSTHEESVVVLDREPFLVAEVHYPHFKARDDDQSQVIATWQNFGLGAGTWQLRFEQQPFDLVLPPQGVGEQMIRAHGDDERGKDPMRFSLSPPARLELDPRAASTRFSEAPWNLRRILGTPGLPKAGPLVKSLDYELLYGLTCAVRDPGIRLAELFSRVGRIAPLRPKTIEWDSVATNAQVGAFEKSRTAWKALFRRYRSRVATLEPWEGVLVSGPENSVILKAGLSCRFRLPPVSNLDLPFPLPEIDREGTLAGGATRGFESRNVLQVTVLDQQKRVRTSDSAELSDFYLSSLGGWGRQMAGFQNNLTKVYGDAAMGRTHSYKIERIGRIGVFWNLAKHVVVYERAVVPSRQFAGAVKNAPAQDHEQQALAGWPVLRKVREFVEIIEDTRQYPDLTSPTATPLEVAALRRARGFVAHLSFAPGARFNVLSSWGNDIGDTGWKVPLWNPAATPADVYPRPKISVGLITGDADKAEIVPCDIAEPQQLVFYTQTKVVKRNASGQSEALDPAGDPNQWAPVEGIDYVNAPKLSPAKGEFQQGETRHYSANETAVAPGYGACTFKLMPPSAPINIVADRVRQPLRAVLESITMVRGGPSRVDWPSEVGAAAAIEAHLVSGCRVLLKELPDLKGIPLTSPDRKVTPAVAEAAFQRVREIAATKNPFGPLAAGLTEAKKNIDGVRRTLKDDLRAFERKLCDTGKAHLTRAFDDPLNSFEKEIDAAFTGTDAQRRELLERFQNLRAAGDDVLRLVEGLPGATTRFLDRYAALAATLYTELDAAVTRLDASLATRPVVDVRSRLAEAFAVARGRVEAFDSLSWQRPAPWIPDPGVQAKRALQKYLATFQVSCDKALQALCAIENNSVDRARIVLAEFRRGYLDPLKTPQDIARYLSSIGLDVNATYPAIQTALEAVEAWRASASVAWHVESGKLATAIESATSPAQLRAAFNALRDWVGTAGLPDRLQQLCAEAERRLDPIANVLLGRLTELEARFDGAAGDFQNFLNAAGITAGNVERELRKKLDDYARDAREYLDHAAGSLLAGKTDVWNALDTTARVVRAFGEPPQVPKLAFDRAKLGYYYDAVASQVDLTPVTSVVTQINEAQELAGRLENALKPLGVELPTVSALEQLVPAKLQGFDVSSIFPDFAGLDLEHLFTGLKLPDLSSDRVKITHGLDPQTRRGFVRTDVDVPIAERATIFTFGPLSLQLPSARFTAMTIVEGDLEGRLTRRASGKIAGTWQLVISNTALVEFEGSELFFDDGGSIRFAIDPRRIRLPGVMAFLTEAMRRFGGDKNDGLSFGMTPEAFRCLLSIPVPDVQAGAFGMSNIRLTATLSLFFTPKFAIGLDFGIARKDAPFSLTIFILGGGGFLRVGSRYTPEDRRFEGEVEVAITVSASLAIALGPIKGGVYVYLGITALYRSGTGLAFGVLFVIRGEVNVLGIISACIVLMLQATYNPSTKELVGIGRLSIRLKICWCFTLEVEEEVTYHLGSPSGGSGQNAEGPRLEAVVASASLGARGPGGQAVPPALPIADPFVRLAGIYVDMLG